MTGFLIRTFLTPQFGRFLLVGGVAAGLQWTSRFLFSLYMPYAWAIVCAFFVGLFSGYCLNALFVFRGSRGSRIRQISYFSAINVLALPFVWGVSMVLGAWALPRIMPLGLAQSVGNGVGILSPVAFNFVLHRAVTFRSEPQAGVSTDG